MQEFYAATDLQYIPTPAHYKKDASGAFGYPRFKTKKSHKVRTPESGGRGSISAPLFSNILRSGLNPLSQRLKRRWD